MLPISAQENLAGEEGTRGYSFYQHDIPNPNQGTLTQLILKHALLNLVLNIHPLFSYKKKKFRVQGLSQQKETTLFLN